MRHRKIRGGLGLTSAHRRAMLNNMITSLFAHERIRTTVAKAKAARRVAERMITLAKRGTLQTRQLAYRRIRDKEVLRKLFAVLGPRYQDRPGGYTRLIRLAPRAGDGAELAILELVDRFGVTAPIGEERPKREPAQKAEKVEVEEEAAAEADAPEPEIEEEAGKEAPAEGEASDEPPKKRERRRARRRRDRKKGDSE